MKSLLLCAAFIMTLQLHAQIDTPQPSPLSTVSQRVGMVNVTVTYSRPSMKGRTIYNDLVPYDSLWRTGANQATKISLSDTMEVAGKRVPGGDYALFTIPGEQEWTVILNKNTKQSGTGNYQESEDALRFQVEPIATEETYETFTITFSDISQTSASLNILWEDTRVRFPLEDPNVDKKVMAQIDEKMASAGDNAGLYYQAANYYFSADKDLQQAQEWIDKAVALDGTQFWVLHLQAKIHAENDDYDKAKAAAEKSKELAQENGNMDYVRLNEKLLESIGRHSAN